MYVPNHLKWRILLARELKLLYFERENSHRNCKRIFELYGRYLLGTTYDTFLNYLNQLKYEIHWLKAQLLRPQDAGQGPAHMHHSQIPAVHHSDYEEDRPLAQYHRWNFEQPHIHKLLEKTQIF